MKKIKTLLLLTALMLFAGGVLYAQEPEGKADTATVKITQQEQMQTKEQAQTQTQAQTRERTQANTGEQAGSNTQAKAQNQGAGTSGVKKVQSARPDWSKARGARPPSVERPSGSRIPKGAGKPGGAKGPGRR